MSQILKLDHLEYVLSFLRMKLDKFDSMAKERDARELDIGEQADGPSIEVVTSGGSAVHPYLGAPDKEEKVKPLSKLIGITKFSVPNLHRMLEAFLNKFRTREEGYYKVQKEHMVSMSIPFPPVDS